MTPFLERSERKLSFPPRFGQHNQEIYSGVLGCSPDDLSQLKAKGLI
jgi:crotonobetainyl-CoA:carnitine CoA-transferase CaiB-like acyl-CoA transferase